MVRRQNLGGWGMGCWVVTSQVLLACNNHRSRRCTATGEKGVAEFPADRLYREFTIANPVVFFVFKIKAICTW